MDANLCRLQFVTLKWKKHSSRKFQLLPPLLEKIKTSSNAWIIFSIFILIHPVSDEKPHWAEIIILRLFGFDYRLWCCWIDTFCLCARAKLFFEYHSYFSIHFMTIILIKLTLISQVDYYLSLWLPRLIKLCISFDELQHWFLRKISKTLFENDIAIIKNSS